MTRVKTSIHHFLLTAVLLGVSSQGHSAYNTEQIQEQRVAKVDTTPIGTIKSGAQHWALSMDNDIFVPGSRDQDYTYGLNLSFTGDKAKKHWLSSHKALSWINQKFGSDNSQGYQSNSIEYGLFGFTPEQISSETPVQGDRPYASLIYVSSTTEQYEPWREVSWSSSLTLGVLGLKAVGEIQKSIHDATDSEAPEGWDTQISEGGEITARYNLARQRLLMKKHDSSELKSTLQASVGYLTEASWSLSGRIGKLHTPWLSFNPELTSYGEKAAASSKLYEHYLWAGFSVKARAYNAFLQGQFRDSDIEYDNGDIRHILAETWLGYTFAYRNGFSFTYYLRGHTSELKRGVGDRNVVWGGLKFSQVFE